MGVLALRRVLVPARVEHRAREGQIPAFTKEAQLSATVESTRFVRHACRLTAEDTRIRNERAANRRSSRPPDRFARPGRRGNVFLPSVELDSAQSNSKQAKELG